MDTHRDLLPRAILGLVSGRRGAGSALNSHDPALRLVQDTAPSSQRADLGPWSPTGVQTPSAVLLASVRLQG